ncbi:MAG: hypothetical protein L0177_13395 [Chloroflexi bacterium]|nr:hypothetical protein [Chloroflexota bacterium]
MAEEQSGNVRRFTLPAEDSVEAPDTEGADAATYDSLVRRYGEAMFRIGELEDEVASLRRAAARRASENSQQVTPPELAKLLNRIDQLEGQLAAERSGQGKDDSEVSHLRLQIAGLASQLAQAQDELKKYRGRVHRKHQKRGSRWKFWEKKRRD